MESKRCMTCGAFFGSQLYTASANCDECKGDKVIDNKKPKPKITGLSDNSPLDKQVGGDHYKNMVIQPLEYTHKNNLNFCQGNIVKYVTRYKNKNGIEDLKKVIHYTELLIELEYGKQG